MDATLRDRLRRGEATTTDLARAGLVRANLATGRAHGNGYGYGNGNGDGDGDGRAT